MQEFFINQHSVNPVLRMELICDGKYDDKKSYLFNNAIQNANITFSMKNIETNRLKISKSPADIVSVNNDGCGPIFLLQYTWNNRDVKEKGVFKAWFEIFFNDDLYENQENYPAGNLIVPIGNELIIHIL